MNTRQIEILILIKDCFDPITINDLADLFKVSIRTIQNDIKIISEELSKKGIILNRNDSGIYVEKTIINEKEISSITYDYDLNEKILPPDERAQLLFNILLLRQGYISINNLAKNMNVSRGTILGDLNKLRTLIEEKPFGIVSSKFGVKLNGDEKHIREFTVNWYLSNSINQAVLGVEQYHLSSICNRYIKTRSLFESTIIFDTLQKIIGELNNYYSGASFISIISFLELAIERTKLGKCVYLTTLQKESIFGTKEFKIVHHCISLIAEELGIVFPVDETCFITLKLFSAGFISAGNIEQEDNYAEIQLIVCTLIDKVASYLNIEVNYDQPLYNNLVYHIKPAIYRLKNNIYQSNPLINEIKRDYPSIFMAVKNNISFIEKMIGSCMSDDEVAFIAIHFLSFLERTKMIDKKYNVLVVCDSGIGTSNLLASRLTTLYDINIVDTVALYQLNELIDKHQIDYIISTIEFNVYQKGIPVIKVSPFITEHDKLKLNEFIKVRRSTTKIDAKALIDELKKHSTIHNNFELIEGLKKNLSMEFKNENWEGNKLMLKDVISVEMIKVGYKAKDWEDAVREAGKLLQNGGCVNQEYIDSMVSTVKRVGTYIVISKGIALPHSRSGDGAFKVGISLLKLDEPVVFGHPENDPVDLVFGLSSIDNSSHITALQDLASTLVDNEKIEYLRLENDPVKLFEFLSKEQS